MVNVAEWRMMSVGSQLFTRAVFTQFL